MTLGAPGRYARWPRWAAILLMAATLALAAAGVLTQPTPASRERAHATGLHRHVDIDLYREIAERVAAGENYYDAAIGAQRRYHYPLKPFVTVRLPTLALVTAALGETATVLLLRLLSLVACAALVLRLRKIEGSPAVWAVAGLLAATACGLLGSPWLVWWHESWAALLIALSLGLRSRRHWAASVCVGLAAALFREHAVLYLCVMTGFAMRERNWREATAWIAAVIVFTLALSAHAAAVASHVTPSDAPSPGWTRLGGLPFVLSLARRCTIFSLLPWALAAIALPFALLGWAGRKDETSGRAAALLLLYLAVFMLIGRPENFYWGLLVAPILPVGLAFVPGAVRDLVAAVRLQRLPGSG